MSRQILTRQGDGAGYHLNDDRSSGGGQQEHDVVCCPHCQAVMFLQDWRKERSLGGGGWCRQCFAPVCGPCLDIMLVSGCVPFMQKVEQALEADIRKRQNAKVIGI